MEKIPVTLLGYARMEVELRDLKTVQRPNVIKDIATAREHGDLSENAEYHAAREQQSFIEGRIDDLESRVSLAEVIDPKKMAGDKTVKFGATVEVVDEDTDEEHTYQIVGDYESDIEKGKISIIAPISRALIGKAVEDSVEVVTPKGTKAYEILGIRYE